MEFSVYQQYLKSRNCKGKDNRHEDFTSLPPYLFLMLGTPTLSPQRPFRFPPPPAVRVLHVLATSTCSTSFLVWVLWWPPSHGVSDSSPSW